MTSNESAHEVKYHLLGLSSEQLCRLPFMKTICGSSMYHVEIKVVQAFSGSRNLMVPIPPNLELCIHTGAGSRLQPKNHRSRLDVPKILGCPKTSPSSQHTSITKPLTQAFLNPELVWYLRNLQIHFRITIHSTNLARVKKFLLGSKEIYCGI